MNADGSSFVDHRSMFACISVAVLAGCGASGPSGPLPPPDDRPDVAAPIDDVASDASDELPALHETGVDVTVPGDTPITPLDAPDAITIDVAPTDLAATDRGFDDVPTDTVATIDRPMPSDTVATDIVTREDVSADLPSSACGDAGVCAAGRACCAGRCVDLQTDARHCGACGNACAVACSAGRCALITQAAVGHYHTCAALSDRTVRCWGSNEEGQLGTGSTSRTPTLRPTAVPSLVNTSFLAAGRHHTIARREDGTVALWGENGSGAIGDGTSIDRLTPLTLAGVSGVGVGRAIGAAPLRSCVIQPLGRLYCWGINTFGQVGDGTIIARRSPTLVPGIEATSVAVGALHTCAVLRDRTVRCWGRNFNGQLGDSSTTDRIAPTAVSGIATATDLCAGEAHSCVRLANGTVSCWGRNLEGQLGDGTTTDRTAPTPVPGLERITAVSCGAYHTCAVGGAAPVRCWGSNLLGELGVGSSERSIPRPEAVSTPMPPVHVFAGWNRTCVITTDNQMLCWGENGRGALGDGTTTSRSRPVSVVW